MQILISVIYLSLVLVKPVLSLSYALSETIVGPAFYDKFSWRAGADPSHGRTNYTDKETSRRLNLTYSTDTTFILRSDFKTVLDPNTSPGRNSVRIRSIASYTTHVAIFDVRHMPEGCGTWPAIWETKESTWPAGGEVDIVEGIHGKPPNLATLHTTAGCVMPANRTQSGSPANNDCQTGCNVRFPTSQSFGPTFNSNGGGWFAMERTTTFIKVWFWPRTGGTPVVPTDISSPKATLDTATWGNPAAFYPDTTCDIPKFFADHNIIINLTFCGDWAGLAYASSGCPSTCADFVNKNTDYFSDAYFDISAVRIYK